MSSHVGRVAEETAAAGYRVGVLDHFGGRRCAPPVVASLRRNPLRYLVELGRHRADVVHYHHAGRPSVLLGVALARRRRPDARWLMTVHNHSLARLVGASSARGRVVRWAISQFDEVVAVSDEVRSGLVGHLPHQRVSTVPAFVGLGAGASAALDQRSASSISAAGVTLLVSAYRVRPRRGGDTYGIDIAADVFKALARDLPSVRLAVFLARPPRGWPAKRYLARTRARIERDWPGRIHIAVGQPLVPALGSRTVYLRPSRTDGDSVSIREALALGVPVIASDVTSRPRGVRVVALHDRQAWVQAVADAVRTTAETNQPCRDRVDREGSMSSVLALYGRHLER